LIAYQANAHVMPNFVAEADLLPGYLETVSADPINC
jgi:hypothetical protein